MYLNHVFLLSWFSRSEVCHCFGVVWVCPWCFAWEEKVYCAASTLFCLYPWFLELEPVHEQADQEIDTTMNQNPVLWVKPRIIFGQEITTFQ